MKKILISLLPMLVPAYRTGRFFTLFMLVFFANTSAHAQSLPPWREGFFDIHHISTGSGNCAFMVFPDGTTMIVDAGDVNSPQRPSPVLLKTSPRLPHDSLTAAKSIAMYIRRVAPQIKSIDYAVVTHFHGDHYGVVSANAPLSKHGPYRVNGLTELNEYIEIRKIIDRSYPDYNTPVDIRKHHFDTVTFNNYLRFVNTKIRKDKNAVQMLKAGSKSQIVLQRNASAFKSFQVRNVKANGELWTGQGDAIRKIIPDNIPVAQYNENPFSLGLLFQYGDFDYFTGGDMTGISGNGLPDWFDVETPVGQSIQEVDALSLNHHGVRDAMNESFLKATKPRILIQQSWSSNHPGEDVLHRMISPFIYEGPRDIFATYVHQATLDTYGRWMNDNYDSKRGHIVIRVNNEGKEYQVFILNDTDPELRVEKTFGPYTSR